MSKNINAGRQTPYPRMPKKKWKEARASTLTVSICESGFPSTSVRCVRVGLGHVRRHADDDPHHLVVHLPLVLIMKEEFTASVRRNGFGRINIDQINPRHDSLHFVTIYPNCKRHLQRVASNMLRAMHMKLATQIANLGVRTHVRLMDWIRDGRGWIVSTSHIHFPKIQACTPVILSLTGRASAALRRNRSPAPGRTSEK